jgi:hypothetical protein
VRAWSTELAEVALACDVDDVLITDELQRRPPTKTDYLREKLALQDLALQMADHPAEIVPRLVGLAMELCEADSAGISLYEAQSQSPGIFRWYDLTGDLAGFAGATTPREFSPCGICLDQRAPVLMAHAERFYPGISDAHITVPELLLVPLFQRKDAPLGTLWIVGSEGRFNAGHSRVMADFLPLPGLPCG